MSRHDLPRPQRHDAGRPGRRRKNGLGSCGTISAIPPPSTRSAGGSRSS
ncbi:MAG: hypothetical protein M0C28_26545 [Candidatus Moduliflexus flocculans]|nr:hypothetical protein [Candidatus Moduliflexus flocculans]